MNDQICKNCNLSIHPIPYCHCNDEVTAFNYKDLLDKTIKSKLEAVEKDCKEAVEYPDGAMNGAWLYIGKIKEIINKHK